MRMTFSARCLAEIRIGFPHGGDGGVAFNDQTDLKLSMMTPCIGVELYWCSDDLVAARFIYPTAVSSASKVYHGIPYTHNPALTHETFLMQGRERINKVTWYVGEHRLVVGNKRAQYVRGIQFYTTAGRISKLYGASEGDAYTESFDGFILGPVAGKSGAVIDQLQFTWIKSLE